MRYLFQSERMAKVTGSLSVQPSLFDMFFEEFLSQVEHFTFYFLRSFTFCVLVLLISNVFLQEFFSLSSEPRPHFPVSEVFHGFSLQHYLFYPTSLFLSSSAFSFLFISFLQFMANGDSAEVSQEFLQLRTDLERAGRLNNQS